MIAFFPPPSPIGLDILRHPRSSVENPGTTLQQTQEQRSVHERDGPVLRMERTR